MNVPAALYATAAPTAVSTPVTAFFAYSVVGPVPLDTALTKRTYAVVKSIAPDGMGSSTMNASAVLAAAL